MRQIRLILDTPVNSIGYRIDLEKMRYESGSFGFEGGLVDAEESGEITDKDLLAKRLYLIIKAALNAPEVEPELPQALEASEEVIG